MSRPAGTGSPRFRPIVNADREDYERLMAEMTTPSTSSTTSTTVVPPAGTGTVQEEVSGDSSMVTVPDFDIDDPNNILFMVSILQHPLPANLDRYDLICDNNITKSTVDDNRQNFIDQMEAAGQSYDPFPIIDWKKVKGSKKPAGKKRKKPPPSLPDDDDDDEDIEDNQNGMKRTLDVLNEDAKQRFKGRRIHNITHTNTVTTVYNDKDGGRNPIVRRTSTRNGPGARTRKSGQRGGAKVPFVFNYKRAKKILTDPDLFKFPSKQEKKQAADMIKFHKKQWKQSGTNESWTTYAKKQGLIAKRRRGPLTALWGE